jgi:hypothetical protein
MPVHMVQTEAAAVHCWADCDDGLMNGVCLCIVAEVAGIGDLAILDTGIGLDLGTT